MGKANIFAKERILMLSWMLKKMNIAADFKIFVNVT